MPIDRPISNYAQLREYNKYRIFKLRGRNFVDGKFMTYGVPAEGTFIWTINSDGNLVIGLRQSRDIHLLPHSALSDGKPVYGAGEVVFKNGEIVEMNAWSGHYVPAGGNQVSFFNHDSISALEDYARFRGLRINNNVKRVYGPPPENPGRVPVPEAFKANVENLENPAWRLPGD